MRIPTQVAPPPAQAARSGGSSMKYLLLLVAVGVLGGIGFFLRSYVSQKAEVGTLSLESNPRGAEVWVDGTSRGVTPISLQLPPGKHSVELRRRGANRDLGELDIAANQETKQSIDLTTTRAVGTLSVKSNPVGAKIIIDGKPRGVTPNTLNDLAVGPHKVTLESTSGSITKDIQITAGGTVTMDEGIFSGWIAVFAPFPLQVYDKKKLIGSTENERIMLNPGRHDLELVNEGMNLKDRRTVDVKPGETVPLSIEAAEQKLKITAPEGAEITIDGESAGVAPLEEKTLKLGSHEIVVKHPTLGEKTVNAVVTSEKPVDLKIALP